MAYFAPGTGSPERAGKVIGDPLSAMIVVAVIILIFSSLLR